MERGLESEQQPDGSRRHLAPDGQAVGRRPLDLGQKVAPRLGPLVALGQRDRQRAPRQLDEAPDHGELGPGIGPEVRDQFHHPVPGVGHAERDRLELVGAGTQRRRGVARRRAVVQGARGREADGARPHRLRGQAPHGRRILLRSLLQAGGSLTHDVEAQRAVRELGAEIDVVGPPFDRVEILPEALPLPVDAFVEHCSGDVLHPLHEGDEAVVRVGPHRREPDAAVAHDGRRHPVPARRREVCVPRGLPVVVRVDVDEAGRHEHAAGLDLLPAPPGHRADGHDGLGVDGDVGRHRLASSSVGHVATPDHKVVCHAVPALRSPQAGR